MLLDTKIYEKKNSVNIWSYRTRWFISPIDFIEKETVVHGVKRRSSFNTGRIDHIYQDPFDKKENFFLHYGDVSDSIISYKD